MSVHCDGCGTDQDVRRSFVTVWNGNIFDLCRTCRAPLVRLLDTMMKDPPPVEPE